MFSLDWTTPSRQSQDRTLDPLPVELYTHILNHFAPRNFDYPVTRGEHKELVNIALVCRCFCATVLPWIFHTLSWPYDGNAMTTLCQGLVQNAPAAEALALFVKKASVLQKPMESSLATDAFIRLHLNGVCRMKELRSLTLSHIAPKKRLCRILEELPNLSTLELLYCISNDNGAPMKEPIALPPSLTTLRMLGTRWPSLVDSVDLQVLRELTTNHEDLLSRIQKVETLPMESFLWCGSSHLMTPSLLDRMPNLKKLCYNYDWQETGTVCNLDFGRVVPLLEEACLPLDFVWRFNISERRLAKLSIAPSRRLAPHQIETLDVCSSRMKSLCIPHGCYTAWECASNFPNLQSLEITNVTAPTPGFSNFGISLFTPYILDEFLRFLLPFWTGHPTLRRFVIWASDHPLFRYDLPAQHDVLVRLVVPKFPKMEEFRMTEAIFWIREPGTAEWFPDVRPPISRDFGKALTEGRCRDYRDAFANLLRSRPPIHSNYVGPPTSWHFDNFSWVPRF